MVTQPVPDGFQSSLSVGNVTPPRTGALLLSVGVVKRMRVPFFLANSRVRTIAFGMDLPQNRSGRNRNPNAANREIPR
jgi:hypothetical protein